MRGISLFFEKQQQHRNLIEREKPCKLMTYVKYHSNGPENYLPHFKSSLAKVYSYYLATYQGKK